jgi:hypothetical protein
MSLEYVWKLKGLKKATSTDVTDAIIGTQWKLTGTDTGGTSGDFDGATPFKLSEINPEVFTPFSELTELQVMGWIQNYVSGSNGYWEHINEQINKQIESKKIEITDVSETDLPWSTGSLDTTIAPPSE